MTVHIHQPPVIERRIVSGDCPNCGWTRFIGFFYEWYGWFETCLRCGEQWSDGEMLERPFRPGWRKANVRAAKKHWRLRREDA